MFKKFSSGKISGTTNALFFLSRAPTHNSFTFNLRFSHELKAQGSSLKNCLWDFLFSIPFRFYKVYIFVQQNAWTL